MNKLIYIADDDDNIRNLLKTFLEREGFHVTGFPTGDKLFEVFSNSPADLIILDVMMPGHDGFFILKEIRKTSNVPIIMLTAKDSDADYIQGLDMGSDDYFTKPFSPVKLVSKVKSILKRQEEILRRDAGILGESISNNAKTVGSIVNASFNNATWSERIWGNQTQLRNELSSLLTQGLIQGRNPRVLAPALENMFGVSRRNAERLMATELARVQTDAQMQTFKENDIDEYIFLSMDTACHECMALNEQHFPVKDAMPGENAPPIHPNCRCSTAAYIDREAVERELFGNKGIETAGSNVQPTGELEVLGKAVFKTGGINTAKYVDQKRLIKEVKRDFHPENNATVVTSLRNDFKAWINSLSEKVKNSVRKYTKNEGDKAPNRFFERINRGLREGNLDKTLQKHVDNISSALKEAVVKRDVIAYRGVDVDPTIGYEIGEPFLMDQFISTSVIKKHAFGKKYFLEVWVKKGTKGAGYIEEISEMPTQRELLIDKDVAYRVLSRQGNHIILEVICD